MFFFTDTATTEIDTLSLHDALPILGMKPSGKKVPGIVLVHGGGGTAFSEWAEIWAKRGYAAIAMDLAGRGAERKRLEDGGPDQTAADKFGAIDGPLTDQWTYHAVANVILAHSLLRRFDEVDVDRTALTGISWGGYLTCIVAGLDQRFQVVDLGFSLLDHRGKLLAEFDSPGDDDLRHLFGGERDDLFEFHGPAARPLDFA